MLDEVRKIIENSPVILKGDYPYIITPLMDGVPSVEPNLLKPVTERMSQMGTFDCDLILAPEAMGIPFATILSLDKNIPFSVVRKRSYGLDGEIGIVESTGYSSTRMYINGVKPGMKVVIVDDVVSTGGTLKSVVNGLRDAGVIVTEVIVALNKNPDISVLEKDLGIPIRYVAKVWIENGKARCTC